MGAPPPEWPPGQQPGQGWGPPPPGYGGGYGPPPGFGAPAYAVAPPTEGKATGALVCAILSFFLCPIVLAVVALVLAGQATRAIQESMGRLGGAGMVSAARILAWINIALSGVALAFFVFAIALTAGAARQI